MQWVALLIGVTFIAAIIAAYMLPLRLAFTAKGSGEFGKFWVIALGGQLLFVTVSFAVAHGVDSIFQVHVFGFRVLHISPVKLRRDDGKKEPEPSAPWTGKVSQWRGGVERWFDLEKLLEFAVDFRRFIHLERFNGHLSYATPDVAITGMLSGSLFTLAGLLAPFGTFRVEPQWVDVAKAAGNLDVAVRFHPIRMLLHVLIFTIKNIKLRQQGKSRPVPAQP